MAHRSVDRTSRSLTTRPARGVALRGGFTLIDVLVVISVIALLLSLMIPAIGRVTESARRVVCGANLHQIGLGLAMWANDNDGYLPTARHADDPMMREGAPYLQIAHAGVGENDWDGLGLLYARGYITAPSLFYCPSHRGENPFEKYNQRWQSRDQQIVMNYHYRWLSTRHRFLDALNPDVTLVVDGLRTVPDYNHLAGNNMLKADMRVEWFTDVEAILVSYLPQSMRDPKVLTYDAGPIIAGLDVGAVARPNQSGGGGDDKSNPLLNGVQGW